MFLGFPTISSTVRLAVRSNRTSLVAVKPKRIRIHCCFVEQIQSLECNTYLKGLGLPPTLRVSTHTFESRLDSIEGFRGNVDGSVGFITLVYWYSVENTTWS